MAKGAAKEETLGGLHSQLARVFGLTLSRYERMLDAIDNLNTEDVSDELVNALLEIQEPNPAMLSAISKFLKDNDIGMDSEEVGKLNETERRLQDRREARKRAGVNLSVVPAVDESYG